MPVLGIDLGTTNTVACLGGRVLRVEPEGGTILSSTVAFPPNGQALVGAAARRRRGIDAKNTVFSSKRIIGQSWHASASKDFRGRYPFEMEEDAEGLPVFVTRAGKFRADQIAARIIRTIGEGAKLDLEAVTGVIAVPSLFRDAQIEATKEAGRAAGLGRVEVIREPAATAAACLYKSGAKVGRVAVYDLGGGTFDMAVVDCSKDPFVIIGHGGDMFLGGDDVDHGLAQWAAREVLQQHRWDLMSDPEVAARLLLCCEKAKVQLGSSDEAVIDLGEVDPVGPVKEQKLVLAQAKLTELASHLVRRTFIICDEVLMQAGLKAQELDGVFLAGGGTLMRSVRDGIEAYFKRPVEYPFDPIEVVAIGAEMQGSHDLAQQLLRA